MARLAQLGPELWLATRHCLYGQPASDHSKLTIRVLCFGPAPSAALNSPSARFIWSWRAASDDRMTCNGRGQASLPCPVLLCSVCSAQRGRCCGHVYAVPGVTSLLDASATLILACRWPSDSKICREVPAEARAAPKSAVSGPHANRRETNKPNKRTHWARGPVWSSPSPSAPAHACAAPPPLAAPLRCAHCRQHDAWCRHRGCQGAHHWRPLHA